MSSFYSSFEKTEESPHSVAGSECKLYEGFATRHSQMPRVSVTTPSYTADMMDEQRASRNYYDYYNKTAGGRGREGFRDRRRCVILNDSESTGSSLQYSYPVIPNAAVNGCSYINSTSLSPANIASPIQFISYGSYVGAQDRDRLTPNYADKSPAGSCNGPNTCFRFV